MKRTSPELHLKIERYFIPLGGHDEHEYQNNE